MDSRSFAMSSRGFSTGGDPNQASGTTYPWGVICRGSRGGRVPCSRFQELDVAEFAVDPRSPEWAEFRDHFPRCAECSREAARFGVLAAALRSENAGASAHPSDAQLLALARVPAELARDERARLEAHLAGCAPCRTELAATRGFAFAKAEAREERPGWLAGIGVALAALLRRPAFVAALAAAVALL